MTGQKSAMTRKRLDTLLRTCSIHSSHRLRPGEHAELCTYINDTLLPVVRMAVEALPLKSNEELITAGRAIIDELEKDK